MGKGKKIRKSMIVDESKIVEENKITETIGLPPGTLVHVGEESTEKVTISFVEYDEETIIEKKPKAIDECFPIIDTPTLKWINITGVHQVEIIEKIGAHLNLHPLLLEDIMNTEQRPKIEDFGDYIFITLKMLTYDDKDEEIDLEQLSIILGKNYVITFEEKAVNALDIIISRLRKANNRAKLMQPDYLAYAMIDIVVDSYYILLDKINDLIEYLEDEMLIHPRPAILEDIYELRRNLMFMHKSVFPLREMIRSLRRLDSLLVRPSTRFYLEDVHDHVMHIMDSIDVYRDMVTSMLDTYLSSISNKLNDVMRILAIFTSIFIPLTFITGVYGMNFSFMPEKDWKFGYFFTWGVMITIAITMLMFFRRKKWL
jgi:magnesium transporter